VDYYGTTSSILERIFRVNTNNPLTQYLPQFVAGRSKHYRNDQHQKSDAQVIPSSLQALSNRTYRLYPRLH
jgi:hypothetical protein